MTALLVGGVPPVATAPSASATSSTVNSARDLIVASRWMSKRKMRKKKVARVCLRLVNTPRWPSARVNLVHGPTVRRAKAKKNRAAWSASKWLPRGKKVCLKVRLRGSGKNVILMYVTYHDARYHWSISRKGKRVVRTGPRRWSV